MIVPPHTAIPRIQHPDPDVIEQCPGLPRPERSTWQAHESTEQQYLDDKERLRWLRYKYVGPTVRIVMHDDREQVLRVNARLRFARYFSSSAPWVMHLDSDPTEMLHFDCTWLLILQTHDRHPRTHTKLLSPEGRPYRYGSDAAHNSSGYLLQGQIVTLILI